MNNKPVAWIYLKKGGLINFDAVWASKVKSKDPIPLYTHPVKEQRCSTCDGTGDVHSIDGQWLGECPWCSHPVKELTDEEMFKANYISTFMASYMASRYDSDCMNGHPLKNLQPVEDAQFLADEAWAILRKA